MGTDIVARGMASSVKNSQYAKNVKNYGLKGDGLTDDSVALIALMNTIKNTGIPTTLYFPYGTYKINNQVTVYTDLVTIVGDGAVIDISGMTNGIFAFVLNTSTSPSFNEGTGYADNIRKGYIHYISGLYIHGTNRGQNAITFHGYDAHIATGYSIINCAITNCNNGVVFHNQSWCITFDNCNISNNNVAITVSGSTNRGERYAFVNSAIHDNNLGIQSYCAYTTIHLVNTSLDYNNCSAKIKVSKLFISDCHIESNKIGYQLNVGENGCIFVKNTSIYINGQTYLGYSASNGRLDLDSCVTEKMGVNYLVVTDDSDMATNRNIVIPNDKYIVDTNTYDNTDITYSVNPANLTEYVDQGTYVRVHITNPNLAGIVSRPATGEVPTEVYTISDNTYEIMGANYPYGAATSKAIGIFYWNASSYVMFITLPKSELSEASLNGVRAYITEHPITISGSTWSYKYTFPTW